MHVFALVLLMQWFSAKAGSAFQNTGLREASLSAPQAYSLMHRRWLPLSCCLITVEQQADSAGHTQPRVSQTLQGMSGRECLCLPHGGA